MSRHAGILMAIGWILLGYHQPHVHVLFLSSLCASLSPCLSRTHFYRHTPTQSTHSASQSVSQCWVQFCSVPVSSKLILLAEASGETSFSGRTWCIMLMILPLSVSLSAGLSEEWRVSFHITTSVQEATAEITQPAEWRDCVDHAPPPLSQSCALSLFHFNTSNAISHSFHSFSLSPSFYLTHQCSVFSHFHCLSCCVSFSCFVFVSFSFRRVSPVSILR